MFPSRIAFIDLETTGANPGHDRITEIGIVEIDGDEVSRWSTLVNPQRSIPEFIQRMTGISNDMVSSAPSFEAVAEELKARLKGRLFVAHNARFDYGFVRQEFRRLGIGFQADVLCTVRLSRALFPEHPKHNLDSLIARHSLVANDRHRALADADLIWQFWQTLRRELDAQHLLDAVSQQLKRPSLPPQLPSDALDDVPESPGVYLFYGENDALLYVGKSVNLRSRVLSYFSNNKSENRELRITHDIRRIDWIETAGELGALLLESRLVKQRQPVHNRRLRLSNELCAWQLVEHAPGDYRPRLVMGEEIDPGKTKELYGLFASKREAANTLKSLAQAYELCPAVLGLEKTARPGQPCFARQLKQCKGACCGKEAIGAHSARLMTALSKLRIKPWPYKGPIGIVEKNEFQGRQDIHLVNAWRYLGTAQSQADLDLLLQSTERAPFDLDTYKLLKAQMGKKGRDIRKL